MVRGTYRSRSARDHSARLFSDNFKVQTRGKLLIVGRWSPNKQLFTPRNTSLLHHSKRCKKTPVRGMYRRILKYFCNFTVISCHRNVILCAGRNEDRAASHSQPPHSQPLHLLASAGRPFRWLTRSEPCARPFSSRNLDLVSSCRARVSLPQSRVVEDDACRAI